MNVTGPNISSALCNLNKINGDDDDDDDVDDDDNDDVDDDDGDGRATDKPTKQIIEPSNLLINIFNIIYDAVNINQRANPMTKFAMTHMNLRYTVHTNCRNLQKWHIIN